MIYLPFDYMTINHSGRLNIPHDGDTLPLSLYGVPVSLQQKVESLQFGNLLGGLVLGKLLGHCRKVSVVKRDVRVAGLLVKASVMLLYILCRYLHQKLMGSPRVKLIVLSEDMIHAV